MNSLSLLILILCSSVTVWSSPVSQQCENSSTSCQLEETCCERGNDASCCPLSNAVCCQDQAHCCPQGYQCSGEGLVCEHAVASPVMKTPIRHSMPLRRFEKFSNKNMVDTVECPDQISVCADDTTCCKLESGMWGCCEIKDAACCDDGIHCCIWGYKCVEINDTMKCQLPSMGYQYSIPASRKIKATLITELIAEQLTTEVCADSTECTQKHTCCALNQQGDYGCSGEANAVCCADKQSWCPQGYSCDLFHGQCSLVTTQYKQLSI